MFLLLVLIFGGLFAFVALGVILALAVTSSNQPPYVKKNQNVSKAQATTKQPQSNSKNKQQTKNKVSNQNSKQSSNNSNQ